MSLMVTESDWRWLTVTHAEWLWSPVTNSDWWWWLSPNRWLIYQKFIIWTREGQFNVVYLITNKFVLPIRYIFSTVRCSFSQSVQGYHPIPSSPVQSTYRFDFSNLFNMALTDQTKMKINESGREWMKVDECGWMWTKLDEIGCNWMKLDEIGWNWM